MQENPLYPNERKTSLQAIKEYILSLLKKKQSFHETTKELEDTLNSESKEALQQKQEQNFREKMKKKLFEKEKAQNTSNK
ncbi:MAG: hypothetical protein LBP53_08850 [Candidatus Peribacteria bacterium]|jgi:hypothetical protein|nr:hypothetical protein [Candidatus Peribacteria bacterium]